MTLLIVTPGLLMSTPVGNCCDGGGAGADGAEDGSGAGAGAAGVSRSGSCFGGSPGAGAGEGVGADAGALPGVSEDPEPEPLPPPQAVKTETARNKAVKAAPGWAPVRLVVFSSFMICFLLCGFAMNGECD
jgi:hypothetical protein